MCNTISLELPFGNMNAVVGASLYGALDICLTQRVQRGRGGYGDAYGVSIQAKPYMLGISIVMRNIVEKV